MTTTRKTFEERMAEGREVARERFASLSPEDREMVEATLAGVHSRFVRMLVGTELEETPGHMPGMLLSVEEMREFRTTTPATHRWVELERSVLG